MKVLLAEDDVDLGESICMALKEQCYIVDWYQDGIAADEAYKAGTYDVFILDIGLPKKNGFSIIDNNKALIKKTPIIILTSLSSTLDCVTGLNKGADDYITKPFELSELQARILSIVRRNKNLESLIIEHKDLKINIDNSLVYFKDKIISLPYKEFLLLKILMLNKGRALNKEQIIDKIYPAGEYIESNVVEAHVYNLRKIIGKGYIKTVRSFGYMMG